MNVDIDQIIEIGIDDRGRLYIKPKEKEYPMIYREAVEVHWDHEGKFLYSPKPRDWSYFDWFRHILDTADPRCMELKLTEETKWKEINEELRFQIEAWMKNRTLKESNQSE